MSIKVIKEPPVRVTAGELMRYQAEYRKMMAHYAGPPITFEEFVKNKRAQQPEKESP